MDPTGDADDVRAPQGQRDPNDRPVVIDAREEGAGDDHHAAAGPPPGTDGPRRGEATSPARGTRLDVRERSTQIGLALIFLGLLASLGTLGVWDRVGGVLRLLAFVAAGVVVLRLYRNEPGRLWTLPVGAGLIGLGVASWQASGAGATGAGGAFLGSVGLGFAAIYLLERERWWALLPAGATITLAVVASLDEVARRNDAWSAATFFVGLGATFALVALTGRGRRAWAWWPAAGSATMGWLVLGAWGMWVIPTALVVAGAWMLSRSRRRDLDRDVRKDAAARPTQGD